MHVCHMLNIPSPQTSLLRDGVVGNHENQGLPAVYVYTAEWVELSARTERGIREEPWSLSPSVGAPKRFRCSIVVILCPQEFAGCSCGPAVAPQAPGGSGSDAVAIDSVACRLPCRLPVLPRRHRCHHADHQPDPQGRP